MHIRVYGMDGRPKLVGGDDAGREADAGGDAALGDLSILFNGSHYNLLGHPGSPATAVMRSLSDDFAAASCRARTAPSRKLRSCMRTLLDAVDSC